MFRRVSITTVILFIWGFQLQALNPEINIINNLSGNISPEGDEMPLTVIPVAGAENGPVFFLISGDGGWTSFDNSFCELLAKKGIPVVGIDARKYFWKAKSPEETTSALASVIENYTKKWNSPGFVLAGYSFGADLVPFIATRLPDSQKSRLKQILLLSPDRYGDFEIHLTDMLSMGIAKKKYNIVNEVKGLKNVKASGIFGQDEDAENIRAFRETGIKIWLLPGDHHYNKNVGSLAETIIKSISE
jgi:type IV secretory pathway VirJ component